MPRLATVEPDGCMLLFSSPSALYLSNPSGFHATKVSKGRSLGGRVAYIYAHAHVFVNGYVYVFVFACVSVFIFKDVEIEGCR